MREWGERNDTENGTKVNRENNRKGNKVKRGKERKGERRRTMRN